MKINLKVLMTILVFIPVIILTSIAGLNTYKSFEIFKKTIIGKKINKINAQLIQLIKALGDERGTTAILMASKGNFKFKNKSIVEIVNEKRKTFDNIYEKLINIYNSEVNNEIKQVLPFEELQNIQSTIKKIRSIVDEKIISKEDFNEKEFNKIFDQYTKVAKEILKIELKLVPYTPVSEQKELTLFARLSKIVDNFGIIRGKTAFYTISNYVMDQNIYKDIYIDRMTDPNILVYNTNIKGLENIFNTKEYKKVRKQIIDDIFNIEGVLQSYYNSLEDNPEFLGYPLDAKETWNIFTKYINFIIRANNILKNNINNINAKEYNKSLQSLIINIIILLIMLLLIVTLFILKRNFEEHMHELEKLILSLSRTLDMNVDIKNIKVETSEGLKKVVEIVNNAIRETEQARKTAEESVKAKSLFLANMSHEIRTPLNGILGFLDLLKTTDVTLEQEEYISTIEKSAKNLLQIVNNILDVSKIESNKVSLENIEFKTMDELESALEVFATPCGQKEIEYVVDLDPTLPRKLRGDVLKIKEIFTNLINNAIKFTEAEGSVIVTIKNEGIIPDTNKIKLYAEVKDTGIGMTEEQRRKVFEAFSQADVSVQRKYGGTGLGLTIVKNYIEMMGGEIDVESELNKGTKFYFTLSLEVLDKEPKYQRNELRGKTFCVLNTKKNTKRKEVLFRYLKYLGVETIAIEDIKEYNEIKKTENIDGIIALYSETVRTKLKELEDINDNVLVVSSFAYKEEVEKISDITIWDPVFISKILTAIEHLDKSIDKKERKSVGTVRTDNGYAIKALIAEDNVINQKLLSTTLKNLGIESDIVDNGLKAFNKYTSHYDKYDVIFMDVQMPIMDGIEATEQILEEEEENDIPHVAIIAVTANALKGDKERFLGAGMDDYISKPINKDELIKVIEKVIAEQYGNKLRTKRIVKEEQSTKNQTQEQEVKKTKVNKVYYISKNREIEEKFKDYNPQLLTSSSEVLKELEKNNKPLFIIEEIIIPKEHIEKLIEMIKNKKPEAEIYIIGKNTYKNAKTIDNIEEIKI